MQNRTLPLVDVDTGKVQPLIALAVAAESFTPYIKAIKDVKVQLQALMEAFNKLDAAIKVDDDGNIIHYNESSSI